MGAPRTAPVPAALRPKPKAPPPPAAPRLHLALVVPDARLQLLLKDRVFFVGPTGQRLDVTAHVLIDDKKHAGAQLDHWMRWALVESGLVPPEDVGLIAPVQVDLGWATHQKDTQ